ncbi:hypothetical protein [Streptomyces sp. 061-3]|uniref:hypothetical protein n=1 Tax=Streptomyces sp. 061-3 TaxID=2789268 RepID=UPI00397EF78C
MPPRPATKAATAPVSAVLGVDISARSTEVAVVDATTGRLFAVGRPAARGGPSLAHRDRSLRRPRERPRDPIAPATAWGTGRGRGLPAAPRSTATWHGVTSAPDRATPSLLNTHS